MRNTLPKSVCGIKYIYKFIGVWCTGNNKVYMDIIKITENRVSMYTLAQPPIPNIKYIKYKEWWVPWPPGMSYPSHVIGGECPYCFRTPLSPEKNKNENNNDYNGHTHLSNAAIKFQLPNTCSKRKGGITKPSFFQWLFLALQHPPHPTPQPPTPTPTHPHTHTHTPITISSQSCSYHTGHIFGGRRFASVWIHRDHMFKMGYILTYTLILPWRLKSINPQRNRDFTQCILQRWSNLVNVSCYRAEQLVIDTHTHIRIHRRRQLIAFRLLMKIFVYGLQTIRVKYFIFVPEARFYWEWIPSCSY